MPQPDIQPTGTITFLFTDIEGSTRLWQDYPEQMQIALVRHDTLVRKAMQDHHGYVFKSMGDAFCAAFLDADDGVNAALAGQQELFGEHWNRLTPIRVRMGLHTGNAHERDGDYFGNTINRCARLMAAAHGGQMLLSHVTCDLVKQRLPPQTRVKDLGDVRLKDLSVPERVYQLLHPRLPCDFPPLRTMEAVPNNLPLQITSFIGRETQLRQIRDLLGSHRIVTLTGERGAGKTRTALQVAADVIDWYPSGAWLVQFASVTDPEAVPAMIGGVLGLSDVRGDGVSAAVANFIGTKRLLLIFDSVESVLPATAKIADELLRACPGLHILVTSREPLGVGGEYALVLPGVALGNLAKSLREDAFSQYESLRSFVEKTVDVVSDFASTTSTGPIASKVGSHLERLDQAFESAAARVGLPSIESLKSHFEGGLRQLFGGRTDVQAPVKPVTAQSAIAAPLEEQEWRLLCVLSTFPCPWSVAAAEEICAEQPWDRRTLLITLASLVHKGVVGIDEGSGVARYCLSQPVQREALEHMATLSQADALKARGLYAAGCQAIEESRLADAEPLLRESLELRRNLGDKKSTASTLDKLGLLANLRGRCLQAAMLLCASEMLREDNYVTLPSSKRFEIEGLKDGLESALGKEAFDATWKAASSMTWDQAADYALAGD